MEQQIAPPLQPLLTVAAIAVTVFSAIGAATLTGMIPVRAEATEPKSRAPVISAPRTKPTEGRKPARTPLPEPIYREPGQPRIT